MVVHDITPPKQQTNYPQQRMARNSSISTVIGNQSPSLPEQVSIKLQSIRTMLGYQHKEPLPSQTTTIIPTPDHLGRHLHHQSEKNEKTMNLK